jgi:hypothetical protein
MNYNIIAYGIYVPVTIGLTIWVARTLHKNTRSFLSDIFHGHEAIATSVNNLLQVGFYLIALGYSFVSLKIRGEGKWSNSEFEYTLLQSDRQMVEELAIKLGGFTLIIGLMLFLNLFFMLIMRRANQPRNYNPQFENYLHNQTKTNS